MLLNLETCHFSEKSQSSHQNRHLADFHKIFQMKLVKPQSLYGKLVSQILTWQIELLDETRLKRCGIGLHFSPRRSIVTTGNCDELEVVNYRLPIETFQRSSSQNFR